jgi:hypothetical protein
MEIIGFLGKRGVGKDFIASKLFQKQNQPTLLVAFADHFKIDGIVDLNLEFDKVFGEKDIYTRKKLQDLGTKFGRDQKNPNIWIDKLENWIRIHYQRGIKRFIVTDLRFQNEVDWIHKLGGKVIKIEAPNRNLDRIKREELNLDSNQETRNHISELGIEKITNYDYLIHNDYQYNIESELRKISI